MRLSARWAVIVAGLFVLLASSVVDPVVPQDVAAAVVGRAGSSLTQRLATPLGVVRPGPREKPPLLPVGERREDHLARDRAESWYRIDVREAPEARSLIVEVVDFDGRQADIDLEVLDLGREVLSSSLGGGNAERCIVATAARKGVYARVYLDAPKAVTERVAYTVVATPDSREVLPCVEVFTDHVSVLPLDQAPTEASSADWAEPDFRAYRIAVPADQPVPFWVRITLETLHPQPGLNFDLIVFDRNGRQLARSGEDGQWDECTVRAEQASLFAVVHLPFLEVAEGEASRYTLACSLSGQGPQEGTVWRAADAPHFWLGERHIGYLGYGRQEYFAWVDPGEAAPSAAVLNPEKEGRHLILTALSAEGLLLGRSEPDDQGWCRVYLRGYAGRRLLLHVTSDEPIEEPVAFTLAVGVPDRPPDFAVDGATKIRVSDPVEWSGEEPKTVAVYELEAPLSHDIAVVRLTTKPFWANADLFVCAGPDVVIAASRGPEGSESARVPCAGSAPVYVVVAAAEGVLPPFELSVRGEAYDPKAGPR